MNSLERREIIAQSPISFNYLRRSNIAAGLLHLIQGLVMLYLGLTLEWERNIYTIYLDFNIISTSPPIFEVLPNPEIAFTLTSLGAILASFPLLSSLAHFLIAYPFNGNYNENLKQGMNPYRWYEYSISSSIMIVLICLLTGIWEIWSLVMVFVLNASTMLFGYLMEKLNQYTEKTDWTPFIYGCITGFTPWVTLAAYFISAIRSTGLEPPTFVYYIIGFYFVLFNIFALNMILQYRGTGPWRDYLYGERFYIILSFIAKSILSWIIFVGIYAPF
jgi:hypothetical protein